MALNRWAELWEIVRPTSAPRANGSKTGERCPKKMRNANQPLGARSDSRRLPVQELGTQAFAARFN